MGFLLSFILTISASICASRFLRKKRNLGENIIRYSYGIFLDKKSKFLWKSDSLRIILIVWNLSAKIGTVAFAAIFVKNCMPHMMPFVPFSNVENLGRAMSQHGYRYVSRLDHLGYIETMMAQDEESSHHRELRQGVSFNTVKCLWLKFRKMV